MVAVGGEQESKSVLRFGDAIIRGGFIVFRGGGGIDRPAFPDSNIFAKRNWA